MQERLEDLSAEIQKIIDDPCPSWGPYLTLAQWREFKDLQESIQRATAPVIRDPIRDDIPNVPSGNIPNFRPR